MTVKLKSIIGFDKDKTQYVVSAMINGNLFDAVKISKQSKNMIRPAGIRIKHMGSDMFEVTDLQNQKTVIRYGLNVTIPADSQLKELERTINLYSMTKPKRAFGKNYENKINFLQMVNLK